MQVLSAPAAAHSSAPSGSRRAMSSALRLSAQSGAGIAFSLCPHCRLIYSMTGPAVPHALRPQPEPVKVQINNGRRVERQQLAQDQAADDRDAERTPHLRAFTKTKCQ